MGGYGSTRWGWHNRKCTVEESLKLDLARLHEVGTLEKGMLCKPYRKGGGMMTWHDIRTGEQTGSIHLHVDTHPNNPHLRLGYTTTFPDGTKRDTNEIVRISYTGTHFGGRRAWLHCPRCQKRVRALYNPPHKVRFLCRDCHDLGYVSALEAHRWDRGYMGQVTSTFDLRERIHKLERKLWKCRGNSKNRRRLMGKLEYLERHLDIIIANKAIRQAVADHNENGGRTVTRTSSYTVEPVDTDLDEMLSRMTTWMNC